MKLSIKLAVAALAATCLLAPSSAMAGKSHLLKLLAGWWRLCPHLQLLRRSRECCLRCAVEKAVDLRAGHLALSLKDNLVV